ncbi:hypothetical protein PILCRDRAFT_14204 [Piloderma croceum F 1598]|uniref:Uncharacterized protein n=1 Tax=Piloderma croceum (strain F 1598) TaxID=765440 RepID=A0A0C3ALJ8_PILCF|nr:hypothetical protein PILCRDRAFT_14204 [Piloderma croceum F 1598]
MNNLHAAPQLTGTNDWKITQGRALKDAPLISDWLEEEWLWLRSIPSFDNGVCSPLPLTVALSLPSGCLLTLADLVHVCSKGEFGAQPKTTPGSPSPYHLPSVDDVD